MALVSLTRGSVSLVAGRLLIRGPRRLRLAGGLAWAGATPRQDSLLLGERDLEALGRLRPGSSLFLVKVAVGSYAAGEVPPA